MDDQMVVFWLLQPDGSEKPVMVQRDHYLRVMALQRGPNGDGTISLIEPRPARQAA